MAKDRVLLVVVQRPEQNKSFLRESYEEMKELTLSAGGVVAAAIEVRLDKPSPAHYIREGKLHEIQALVPVEKISVIIFNVDLSPGQARNIEETAGTRVVDRTGLILDIFARRAKSREGKLQVEMAQLNYLLPRLTGKGEVLSRLGGGIGTRGPGEQKLEIDRRRIRDRISLLKRELERVATHRERIRQGRRRKDFYTAALVGYTNAGKSTLLNALTGADVFVEDKLFVTLDPTTRLYKGRGRLQILFTDTVGFLRDLPHGLIEAFKSTLEEAVDADALIHVLDGSHAFAAEQFQSVEKTLSEIGAIEKPALLVLNKSDLLSAEEKVSLTQQFPEGILISARNRSNLEQLMAKLETLLIMSRKGGSPDVTAVSR